MRSFFLLLTSFFISFYAQSQAPKVQTSSEIFERIKKLNVLGSVLYVAAHPDDENTRLLAYLANEKQYRTGYLSITRGDGGQNLIGDELGVPLGLIRTQELLAARRIDGAEQFFTRAFDFGYSKNPEETFAIWEKQKILSDVVWVIRKFQPDVIITRFPTTGEGGHGHHTASAILAGEAFDAAADSTKFPGQFQYGVKPWRAQRLLWNTFNFGSVNTTGVNQFTVDAGGYNNLLGQSYGEIAAHSRSQHKSQGFGVASSRGQSWEYFKTIKGDAPKNDLMDGVLTTWSRENQIALGDATAQLARDFSFKNPERSLPGLVNIYQYLQKMPEGFWRNKKLQEVQDLLKDCAGLYIEVTSRQLMAVRGDSLDLQFVANKRAGGNVDVLSIKVANTFFILNDRLPLNENVNHALAVRISPRAEISQPYWLRNEMTKGSFVVNDQQLIGKPWNDPEAAEITVKINGETIVYNIPVQYKSSDPVKGEEYQPLFIVPEFELEPIPKIALSVNSQPVKVNLIETSNIAGQVADSIRAELPAQITASREANTYTLSPKDSVGGPQPLAWSVVNQGAAFNQYKTLIRYDHIPDIIYFNKTETELVPVNLSIAGKRIGYIAGAGDKVPESLQKMGYEVVILSKEDIIPSNLARLDAVVTGVRAYNVHGWLNDLHPILMKYVEEGGVLLVQYNTQNNIGPLKANIGPYPFDISRNRVTDENAPVTFLLPEDPLLNYPNKITGNDFKNWIQERSTYHAANYSPAYRALLSMSDGGERPQDGSLIYTNYGKGRFIYAGLVFFRELPAGVAGAYRLLANLVAPPQH